MKIVPLFKPPPPASGGAPAPDHVKIGNSELRKTLRSAFPTDNVKDGKTIFLRGDQAPGQSLGDDSTARLTTTQPKQATHAELVHMAAAAKQEIRAILIGSAGQQRSIVHQDGVVKVHDALNERQIEIAGIFDDATAGKPSISRGDLEKIMRRIGDRESKDGLMQKAKGSAVGTAARAALTGAKHAASRTGASMKNVGMDAMRGLGWRSDKTFHPKSSELDVQPLAAFAAREDALGEASGYAPPKKTLLAKAANKVAGDFTKVYSSNAKRGEVAKVRQQVEASNLPDSAKNDLRQMCRSLERGLKFEMAVKAFTGTAKLGIKAATADPGTLDAVGEVLQTPLEAVADGVTNLGKSVSDAVTNLGASAGPDGWHISDEMVDQASANGAEKLGKKAGGEGLDHAGEQLVGTKVPPGKAAAGSKRSEFDDGVRKESRLEEVDDESGFEDALDEQEADRSPLAANQSGWKRGMMSRDEWTDVLTRFITNKPDASLNLDQAQQLEVRQIAEEIVSCVHKDVNASSELVRLAESHPDQAAEKIFARQQGSAKAADHAKADEKMSKALGRMEP